MPCLFTCRLLSHGGGGSNAVSNEGTANSSSSSGEPPPSTVAIVAANNTSGVAAPQPKCYLSSQFVNKSTGASLPLPSSSPSKILNTPNEGRKAFLPLVLQDHNYMAPLPPPPATSTASTMHHYHSSSGIVGVSGINTKTAVLTKQAVGTTFSSSQLHHLQQQQQHQHHQQMYTANSVGTVHHLSSTSPTMLTTHQHGSSPARAYSLSSGKGSSGKPGGALLSTLSASASVTSNVITNAAGSRPVNKLTTPTRPTKAFTYSLPRQPRYTTNHHHQQHQPGVATISSQQQHHYISPVKTGPAAKVAVTAAISNSGGNLHHHRGGVIMQPGGKPGGVGAVTTSYVSSQQSAPHQRYTYKRTGANNLSTVSSPLYNNTNVGGGHPSPIITSILSPSPQPATVQQQQYQNSTGGPRSYIYTANNNSPTVNNNNTTINNMNISSSVTAMNNNLSGNNTGVLSNSNTVLMTSCDVSVGTNNNVNILVNNKTSADKQATSSSISCPSMTSLPPSLTYIPSPHIPPPPGTASPLADLGSGLLTGPRPSLSLASSGSSRAKKKSEAGGVASSGSTTSSDDEKSSSPGPSGEETETAPEGEGDDLEMEDSITRCVCDLTHDDGYMIQCDR